MPKQNPEIAQTSADTPVTPVPKGDKSPKTLDAAIDLGQKYLFSLQSPEGYWVAELESNATMHSEYIFFLHFMGKWDLERVEKTKNNLLLHQQEDGGWPLYFKGPSDIGTTVESYVALKMAGLKADDPRMVRARECIFKLGGVRRARVFTKIFLAMLGQSSWDDIPATPVELILLPKSFYFNIYEMSSWSRGTVVPLSIVIAHQPVWPLEPEIAPREIFTPEDSDLSIHPTRPGLNWPNFFLKVDRFLKFIGKSPWKPLRKPALRRALKWVLDHQEPEGDFAGIQPAMINSMLAMKLMGFNNEDPLMKRGFSAIDRFIIDRGDHLVFQACVSPLWDTSIACNALMDAGVPGDHPAIIQAVEWMLRKQVTRPGDWTVKNPNTPPGGWAFEFYNEQYPDCDDTAEILMAIHRTAVPDTKWKSDEFQRALTWLFSMQSVNGGWAAFDQDNDHELFNEIPFADHGAMLDPPTVDVTGRILWMLGRINHDPDDPRVQRALQFIKSEQEQDGCWFGRWGVNYIYGTWLVLSGLRSIGEDPSQSYIRRAAEWLKTHQNEDGGWGETCESYADPSLRGRGVSTNSQTAWAVMGLIEADEPDSNAARRGIEYLIRNQKADGSWYEDYFTGTGFPRHFYIKYHMYQIFFPLMALARYRNRTNN
ncbi:MAG: squalene--hopene cyclase [Nitrospinaceae bacterium]|nr:squalene--hopene cyclase [Nitrospinaceae bacterium]NIR54093.1 squalene--hopene cyclase [Nitrospinaceae bacterium]NIS84511.1 squalene--hopene cyclase [Nitrospinaceae bacterium]NIT81306.1 squalene--hopene cyclase [Nitrospinaceae bacterium]NIU43593.1 squalene--hopene cyclase [Nitrospinaceae bacterium]